VENTKSGLRNLIRQQRGQSKSHFDFNLITKSREFISAKVIASYRSFGNEPATEILNKLILDSGKQLLLPRLQDDFGIEFCNWDGDLRNLKANGKIEEPIGATFHGKIDLIILPALAVDTFGNRLGQGGGSYDRALGRFDVFTIALINENELVELVPSEPHDQKVKAALTPTRLIRF